MKDSRELIKIDKNGTKYIHHVYPCLKCNGSGLLSWTDYANGVCFDCNGSGINEEIIKEYTPEHEAKLKKAREKREAKARKKMLAELEDKNQEFLKNNGFDQEGNTWIILGNTYSIREQLKELGCSFNYSDIGWHSPRELPEYPSIKLNASDLLIKDENGRIIGWNNERASELISEAKKGIIKESDYVGNVGEKIEIIATYIKECSYDVCVMGNSWMKQTRYIHIFEDSEGNQFCWNTTAIIWDIDEGSRVKLKGTIKEHKEYKGTKQTYLQRCKVEKEGKENEE